MMSMTITFCRRQCLQPNGAVLLSLATGFPPSTGCHRHVSFVGRECCLDSNVKTASTFQSFFTFNSHPIIIHFVLVVNVFGLCLTLSEIPHLTSVVIYDFNK